MTRFTLSQFVAIVAVVAVACALVLPLLHRAAPAPVMCANNLRMMWQLHASYRACYGSRRGLPPLTGSSFWLCLSRTDPPLIDAQRADLHDCPVSARVPRDGQCEYRGPHDSLNALRCYADRNRVVGCDRPTNHDRGGNVLLFSGDVLDVREADPRWHRALEETLP